mmetsp:Transcript_37526/g.107865  ORF Transcript_37526/g.107865 Transcript_37526/m.107865 type:complete len:183 (-) Transcript_37526:40-588(-)
MFCRSSALIAKKAVSRHSKPAARFVHIEKRIEELGLELPPPAPPRANYNSTCIGPGSNMMFLSGHLPFHVDGETLTKGRIGEDGRDVEFGYQAARLVGMGLISTLKGELGDLDRIEKIVKIFGIVNSTSDFQEQHLVMNGCSDLIMEVFGKEIGFHARSAIGTNTLPLGVSVEIEAIVQFKP